MPPYQHVIHRERKKALMDLMVRIVHETLQFKPYLRKNCLDKDLARIIVYNQVKIRGDFAELETWKSQAFAKNFVPAVREAFPDSHGKLVSGMEEGIDSRELTASYIKDLVLIPVSYIHTSFNLFPYGDKQFSTVDSRTPCSCVGSQNGFGCDNNQCLNFHTQIECFGRGKNHQCGNLRIQNGLFLDKYLEIVDTESKGQGIKTTVQIYKDHFIAEYVGEVMTYDQYDTRMRQLYNKNQHFYGLQLEKKIMIDATLFGNLTRFINHSCSLNCRVEKWSVGNKRHVVIVAQRNIEKGEELTYDYIWTAEGHKMICRCDEDNCRGVLE